MRFSVFLLVAFFWIKAGMAQTANTLMFGARLLYAADSKSDYKDMNQSLQVRVGYFATQHLAMGLCVESGINNNRAVPFGMTFFSRWYAGERPQQVLRFFVEAGAGVADNGARDPETDMLEQNRMRGAFHLSPGLNVFPCKAVALELAPEYRYIAGRGQMQRLGMSAGVKIFLSESVFKRTFPNEFRKLN